MYEFIREHNDSIQAIGTVILFIVAVGGLFALFPDKGDGPDDEDRSL